MIVMTCTNLPDIHCYDGFQIASAEAKGYSRKLAIVVEVVKSIETVVEPADTPEAAYERKFGKKPHHRMSLGTILNKLEG